MSNLIDIMVAEGWTDSEEKKESTTFESSKQNIDNKKVFEEEDFENTTGLPAKMMHLNIYELVKKYGGPFQLDKWASILSKLMTANEKDQKIQERRNETIEKDFVISNVFKYLDVFMDAVFDAAESQNEIIIASVLSDKETSRKSIIELRKKSYTKISKEAKKSITEALKRLKNKYDNENDS